MKKVCLLLFIVLTAAGCFNSDTKYYKDYYKKNRLELNELVNYMKSNYQDSLNNKEVGYFHFTDKMSSNRLRTHDSIVSVSLMKLGAGGVFYRKGDEIQISMPSSNKIWRYYFIHNEDEISGIDYIKIDSNWYFFKEPNNGP